MCLIITFSITFNSSRRLEIGTNQFSIATFGKGLPEDGEKAAEGTGRDEKATVEGKTSYSEKSLSHY